MPMPDSAETGDVILIPKSIAAPLNGIGNRGHGFRDKVFTNGWAYEPSRRGVKGHLTHIQRAVVVTTMNTPKWAYRWLYGNAVERALVRGTLRKCGVRNVEWVALSPVSHATDAQREAWLDRVGSMFAA